MVISVDEIAHRKLVVVKQLYQQALLQSKPQSSFVSKMMSVIGFDLSIETMLKTVVGAVISSKSPTDNFNGLVQQVNDWLSKANIGIFPDEANIRHVHSIRNDTQHKAKYPVDVDISDCRTYTRDFLQKITKLIWDISFDEIKLSDLIKYERVKEFLVKAENAFENGLYQETVNQAAASLIVTLRRVEEPIVGKVEQSNKLFVMEDSFNRKGADKDVYHSFRKIQENLLLVVLGMDHANYVRFESLAPVVVFTGAGNIKFMGFNAMREFTSDEAEFVLNYCIDAVVQIENHVGSLEDPFGKKARLSNRNKPAKS